MAVGALLTYSIEVTNHSLFYRVPGVRIVDTLPVGATFVSATPSQGSCAPSNNTVRCEFGFVEAAGTVTATIVVTLANVGPNTNLVVASANGPDTNQTDNAATLVTTANPSANISISMIDAPDPVAVGSNLTYSIVVSNLGPSTASGVTVTNTLASSVTFVSATPSQGGCIRSGNVLTCTLGSVVLNGNATVAYTSMHNV